MPLDDTAVNPYAYDPRYDDIVSAFGALEMAQGDKPRELAALMKLCSVVMPVLCNAGLRPPTWREERMIGAVLRRSENIPKDAPGIQIASAIGDALLDDLAVAERLAVPLAAVEAPQWETLADALIAPEAAESWLVDGMIPLGGLSLMVGAPKAGKSTLARNLVLAAAQGREWLGRAVTQGPALYVTMEGRRQPVIQHFRQMGATRDDPVDLAVWRGIPDGLHRVGLKIRETGAKLAVIDPLFRFLDIADGNDYAAMTAATQPLIDLAAETGCALVAVHHSRKGGGQNGEETLGSTGLFGSVDCLVSLCRDDFDNRTIYSIQREGEAMPATTLRMDEGRGWIYPGPTAADQGRRALEDEICTALRDGPPMTRKQIQAEIQGRKQFVNKAIERLLETGAIHVTNPGQRAQQFALS